MTAALLRGIIGLVVWLVALIAALTPPARAELTAEQARATITVSAPDAFYDPPTDIPGEPGMLLRSEQLKVVTLPEGMQGWRILYTTTVDDDTPATAAATVFAPVNPPEGPRSVIAWAHGTTGVLQKCMPSLVSAPTEGIPARAQVAEAGWVIVATDYSFVEPDGPHPYLIGEGEARAALDAVRAARRMPELMLDARTVVWGHSQGGHAALWTGVIGPRYAPDLEIVGVAAIAPAADMADILARNPAAEKRLGPYVARSYSRFYPDVTFERALRREALPAAREIASLCGFFPPEDPQRIAELTATFDGPALSEDSAVAARLAQNTADALIASPVAVAQGLADAVVLPPATDAWVEARCADDQRLEHWTFARADHGTIVQPGSALEGPLIAWTRARLAGEPQAAGCVRKRF